MTILEDMITAQRSVPGLWSIVVWLVTVSSVAAQQKPVTLDDIYDPGQRIRFSGNPSPAISWIDSTHYAWPRSGTQGVDWTKVDAQTGAETPLFDAGRMES